MSEERKYLYAGKQLKEKRIVPVSDPKTTGKISPQNAHDVVKRALGPSGRVHWTPHFKRRGRQRGFTTIDAENLARTGIINEEGVYCPKYGNWKYKLKGSSAGKHLEMVVALDPAVDHVDCPQAIFVTGYVKSRKSKNVQRKKKDRGGNRG